VEFVPAIAWNSQWGERLTRDNMTPEEEIANVAERIWKPAGLEPQFETEKSIRANHTAFVGACHATWKDIHSRSIQRLLFLKAG